jgi:hypothetical protein
LIPHPLTLLFCWLIGAGLSHALGYVLQFLGELCADAARYGWIGDGAFAAAFAVLGEIAAFAGGFFTGAVMRLLADKSWPKAAGWALLTVFLAHLRAPRFLLWSAPGCFLGAWLCGRFREEARWLDDVEGFLRNWMFWERGGAL